MRSSLTVLGLLTVLALLVAACGGDDTLSVEAYFEALEDVDAAGEAETFFEGDGDTPPDAETIATYFDGLHAFGRSFRVDFAALTAPTELAVAHDALLDAVDAVIVEIERVRATGADIETFFEEGGDELDAFGRACATLQQIATDRGIDLELSCADE